MFDHFSCFTKADQRRRGRSRKSAKIIFTKESQISLEGEFFGKSEIYFLEKSLFSFQGTRYSLNMILALMRNSSEPVNLVWNPETVVKSWAPSQTSVQRTLIGVVTIRSAGLKFTCEKEENKLFCILIWFCEIQETIPRKIIWVKVKTVLQKLLTISIIKL